ncbi:MAG: DUF2971 domain-containing protein [Alphaproteobacteria bacterium]|nr:DUF2971 domain-containing protein [Alphaproteobacteria bacterium]
MSDNDEELINLYKKPLGNIIKVLTEKILSRDDEIYHYTSQDGLKGIIENKHLFFSDARFLNDKTEIAHFYQLLENHIHEIDIKNEELKIILNEIASINNETPSDNNFYVLSFSHDNDSLSMWNYYTKSKENRGYNLHFLSNNLYENILSQTSPNICICGNVIYDETDQLKILKEIIQEIDNFYTNFSSENLKEASQETLRIIIEYTLHICSIFMKNKSFSCENEFRIVIQYMSINKNIENLDFRISQGIFIPYIKIPIDTNDIKGITLSPTQHSSDALLGIKEFLKSKGLDHIECNESQIPIRY